MFDFFPRSGKTFPTLDESSSGQIDVAVAKPGEKNGCLHTSRIDVHKFDKNCFGLSEKNGLQ